MLSTTHLCNNRGIRSLTTPFHSSSKSGRQSKRLRTKGLATAPAILKVHLVPSDNLTCSPIIVPSAPTPDVVVVPNESTHYVGNDTASDLPTDLSVLKR